MNKINNIKVQSYSLHDQTNVLNIANKTPSEEKVNSQSTKITKLDVSGLSYRQKKLLSYVRKLNFLEKIEGKINSHTIITGSSKKWDNERLKEGKHTLLAKIGAEHLELMSPTNCKVDAHFLNAAEFIKSLENMGGQRSFVQFQLNDNQLFEGNACQLEINQGFPIPIQEIHLTEEQKIRDRYGYLKIKNYISDIVGEPIHVIEDPVNKKFYSVENSAYEKLLLEKGIDKTQTICKGVVKESEKKTTLISPKTEFPVIKFEKNSSNWQEAVQLLKNLKIEKTSWSIVDGDTTVYLVPTKHAPKLELSLESNIGKLKECLISSSPESTERGTVLLTMNQTDVYEQYTHEILTFLLEGINVMAYNNPSKGLSTGKATSRNINASLKASYQYLKSLGIPDEKILAKGQCFGGAPTAWLGKKHPNINLMLDQNPANFFDIGINHVKRVADRLIRKNIEKNQNQGGVEQIDAIVDQFIKKYPLLTKLMGKILSINFIVNALIKLFVGNYNVSKDIAYNKGHKLINIDVKNIRGEGGDELVPEHHPEQIIDAIQDNKGKIVTLSQNPGATHVTDWWMGQESQETVIEFLRKTKISDSIFSTKDVVFHKEIPEATWQEKSQNKLINIATKINNFCDAIFFNI